MSRTMSLIALVLFFTLGAYGFAYEIVWMHHIAFSMENTSYSMLVMLAAFVAALWSGNLASLFFARRLEKPLRSFALLSAVIFLFTLPSSYVIDSFGNAFWHLYGGASIEHSETFRFFAYVALVFFPSALIGAALPLLVSFYARSRGSAGYSASICYGAGGMGVFAGIMLSLYLIPRLGYSGMLFAAAALNGAAAVFSFICSKRCEPLPGSAEPAPPARSVRRGADRRIVAALAALFVSGFCVLLYQCAIGVALMLVFDSTVYSLAILLGGFVFALSAGCLAALLLRDVGHDRFLLLFAAQFFIAVSMLAAVYVIPAMPVYVVKAAVSLRDSLLYYRIIQFVSVALIFSLPAFFLGAAFAFAGRIYMGKAVFAGMGMAVVYAVNSVSVIAGLIAGFLMTASEVGARETILIASGVAAASSLIQLFYVNFNKAGRYSVIVASVLILPPAFVIMPEWDRDLMSSGVPVYAPDYIKKGLDNDSIIGEIKRKNSTLYYNSNGLSVAVVTKSDDGVLSLKVDGSVEASTGLEALTVQHLVSGLALILHQGFPKDVLLVGLGSGAALDAVASYPVERIDCVEASPSVIGAIEFFGAANKESFLDNRVNIMNLDGRAYLKYSGRSYDVIASTPSEPWIWQSSAFFTKEYYEAAKKSLNQGGIMAQWVNGNRVNEEDFKSVVRTFTEVFPHALMWEVNRGEGDYILMGSGTDFTFDYAEMKQRFGSASKVFSRENSGISSLPTLLMFYVTDSIGMRRYSEGAVANTDDDGRFDFSTAWNVMSAVEAPLRHNVDDFRTSPLDKVINAGKGELKGISAAYDAGTHLRKADELIFNRMESEAEGEIRKAISSGRDNPGIKILAAKSYVELGKISGDSDEHLFYFKKAAELDPASAEAWYFLGSVHYLSERFDDALDAFNRAAKLDPGSPRIRAARAFVYKSKGMDYMAAKEMDMAERLRASISVNGLF